MAGRGRSPVGDIATPRQGQDVENPQYKLEDGDNFSTPTQVQQSNRHNMYIQEPVIIQVNIKQQQQQMKITKTHPMNPKKRI
jgi:hypothetical protein